MKFLILVSVMLYSLNLYGQNDTTITKADSLIKPNVNVEKQEEKAIFKHTIKIFGGLGLFPIDANLAVGYHIKNNIMGYTKFSFLIFPIAFFDYSTSIGFKILPQNGSTHIYTVELGILFDATENYNSNFISLNKYDGVLLKSGFGYILYDSSNIFIEGNFYLNLMFLNDNPSIGIEPEAEILLGFSF